MFMIDITSSNVFPSYKNSKTQLSHQCPTVHKKRKNNMSVFRKRIAVA